MLSLHVLYKFTIIFDRMIHMKKIIGMYKTYPNSHKKDEQNE